MSARKFSGLTMTVEPEGKVFRLVLNYRCGSFVSEISELHASAAEAQISARWHITNTFKGYLS